MREETENLVVLNPNRTHPSISKFETAPAKVLSLRDFNGPVSGPMHIRLKKIRDHYPDTFNWRVYDDLYNRFGPNQPRGGVVFKSGLKLANFHSSCTKCHYSLELDTYGRGCVHNCLYCYAKETLTQHGYWNQPMPFPLDLVDIRKTFYEVFETDKQSKWRDVLAQRIPIRLGSMSDPFMMLDKKYGITKEVLKILKYYSYPLVAFTRSDLVATDEYLNLLSPKLASVQFSISGDNEELTRQIEPGAPSVKRRLAALTTLRKAGIWTAVRINPLFPTYPDGYFTDKESLQSRFNEREIPKFPLLDIENCQEFLDAISATGTSTLIAGFVRLSKYSVISMSKATGIEMKQFFRTDIPQDARDKRYTDKEIAEYYLRLKISAAKSNLRFTTCYIGNGIKDYFQYQNLWANKSDCCDIKGNVPSFAKTAQSIPWDVRSNFTANREELERGRSVDTDTVPIQ